MSYKLPNYYSLKHVILNLKSTSNQPITYQNVRQAVKYPGEGTLGLKGLQSSPH